MTAKTLIALITEAKAIVAADPSVLAYATSHCDVTGVTCRVVPVQGRRKWGTSTRWTLNGKVVTKDEAAALLKGAA